MSNSSNAVTTAAIQVDQLKVTYGDFVAVHGISFQVDQGAMFGLLGPNGGGKTSTFRVLSTLLAPSEGQAKVLGMDTISESEGIRPLLGVVFQATGLDLKLKCRENLTHQGHMYGLKGAPLQKRIDELLKNFGLFDKAEDNVSTLSGGLKRRLEVAKGLLHKPQVLLLDEPTAGLDPVARRDMWTLLNDWRKKENLTIVLSTHLLDEAEQCDQLVILDRGHLVASGSPDDLKRKVGGDVITITGDKIEDLGPQIKEKFSCEVQVVDGDLRIERQDGHSFIAPLVEAFPLRIQTVAMGKPTLEDVFVHLTGRHLQQEDTDA